MTSKVYYGSIKCSGVTGNNKPCRNKAYWLSNSSYLCGVHSKSDKRRIELKKNPDAKAERTKMLGERQKIVEEMAEKNRDKGKRGDLICVKMGMMKEVEHHDGYLKIFPNFKHQNREDGYGCMSLSPKSIGPIDHKQPNLPIAKNLENMWQGSKCFPHETGNDGNPNEEFYINRLLMYNDPEPHRYKKFLDGSNARGMIPNYTVWNNNHYKYIEARQIYCHFYEKMTLKLDDFLKLKQWLEQGYNLQICGYDAYHVTKSLDEHYKDTSRPFGHEMVLYTLLTIENKKDYPWRKFQTIIF